MCSASSRIVISSRVPDVEDLAVELSVEQDVHEPVHEVGHVAEAARLHAVAVDDQRAARKRGGDHLRDDAAVVAAHGRVRTC